MKLHTAYSKVIRYGLVSKHELTPFLEDGNNNSSVSFDGSHPDYALADYLQDAGDGRHRIVKKDLEYRENSTGSTDFFNNVYGQLKQLTGNSHPFRGFQQLLTPEEEKEHGKIEATKVEGAKGSAYRIHWFPSHETAAPYIGVLNPEEFAEFLTEIPTTKTIKDFDR